MELALYFLGGLIIGIHLGIVIAYRSIKADNEKIAQEAADRILQQLEDQKFGV